MKIKNIKLSPAIVLFAISAAGILAFLIFAGVHKDSSTFEWLLMQHTDTYDFADHFYHIFYGADLTKTYNSFDVDPCFPPLSYLYYNYLYKIAPVSKMEHLIDVAGYPYYMFIFVIVMVIQAALFVNAVSVFNSNASLQKTGKPWYTYKNFTDITISVIALLSLPFGASAIERGNPAFLVVILLLYAIAFKDSDNKYLREIALILIAVAANIKIYPAIFGLLYLKDKRFKEAFHLVIYGLALFIIPFFFMEGFKSIKEYLVIIRLMEGRSIERITTVRGLVTCITEVFAGNEAKWTGHHIGIIVENIYLVLDLLAFFICRSRWKRIFLIVAPMVVYVSSAYRYTAVYFFLPLMIFIWENKGRVLDYLYAVLYGLIFTIQVFAYPHDVENTMYVFIYVLIFTVMIDVFAGAFLQRRSEKEPAG